jgi:hypothetical protein
MAKLSLHEAMRVEAQEQLVCTTRKRFRRASSREYRFNFNHSFKKRQQQYAGRKCAVNHASVDRMCVLDGANLAGTGGTQAVTTEKPMRKSADRVFVPSESPETVRPGLMHAERPT